jgi:predicted deacetylase
MNAQYLLRFDDLCPTMNWQVWEEIEEIMDAFRVVPILAIVPDNRDKKLEVAPARHDFWDQVRRWQAKGWTIGMHGFRHTYVTNNAGIIGIAQKSEFAGLPEWEQEQKLTQAMNIFRKEGVVPSVWIAPSHSFDAATLAVLGRIGVTTISDGLALSPYRDTSGLFWLPQQLWKMRWRPFGIWTVCYHHNSWGQSDIDDLRCDVRQNHRAITDVSSVIAGYQHRRRQVYDWAYARTHLVALSIRKQVRAA